MTKNFAIRLDQTYSVFNSEENKEMLDFAKQNLRDLVKEVCETHLIILSYNNGRWDEVKKLPLNNCAVHPRKDGGFDFIHEGSIQTYGPNCRFAIG